MAEHDEAADAVAALEDLWDSTRREGARRLLRSVGHCDDLPANNTGSWVAPTIAEGSNSSTRGSPASSTVGTPRGTPPASLVGFNTYRQEEDHLSDSGSEVSWGPSVLGSAAAFDSAAAAAAGTMGTSSPSSAACPTPFGVHLEWRLKVQPRMPKAAQLSLQRGICPGCRERLTVSSIFGASPRYCHYLGCYCCATCHQGEMSIIPARVAECWDFEPRAVCSMAARYLDQQKSQPLVPVTRIRQTKVSSQTVLSDMHLLRQKLTRIKKVLSDTSCDFQETLDAIVAMQLPPHMRAGHEMYTLQDLISLHLEGRSCTAKLARLVTMGAEHVQVCSKCQGSARFCLICASGHPVFSYDVNIYHSCKACVSVYHRACFLRAGSECPKCLQSSGDGHRPSVADVCPR